MDEWDVYLTNEVAAWLDRLQANDAKTGDLVNDTVYALSCSGPGLGRPLVDTITGLEVQEPERATSWLQREQRDPHPVYIRPVAFGDPSSRRR